MFLSRIALNVNKRETMQVLASPQMLHGAVEQIHDGERQRNLWRIDRLSDTSYLLVLSPQRPDMQRIADQYGFPDSDQPFETKDYDKLLARLQSGQTWQFRLRANPVRSSSQEKTDSSRRGKVFAHVTQDQQKQWLQSRAPACGFALHDSQFDVVHTEWLKFKKGRQGNHEVTIRTATFEGVLEITDVDRFREILQSGIGRAKAYGCGLLTIMRQGGV